MRTRFRIADLAVELHNAAQALDSAIRSSGLDPDLLHLVKLRASQINGCAFCVDLHVKESLADGIDPQKLHLVAAWRESPVFSARERAALAWTESVTLISATGVPDADYEAVRAEFSDVEVAQLTVAIGSTCRTEWL
jgi:AhpD family alkylhydroperoxidase